MRIKSDTHAFSLGPHRKEFLKSKNTALYCKLANIMYIKRCVRRIKNETKGNLNGIHTTNKL